MKKNSFTHTQVENIYFSKEEKKRKTRKKEKERVKSLITHDEEECN